MDRMDPTDWRRRFRELRRCLIALGDSLSLPRPALLPALHPPEFARLHEHVVAKTVAEQLATLIAEGIKQYEVTRAGGWIGSSGNSALSSRFKHSLDAFLTTGVFQRYDMATRGFESLEALALKSQIDWRNRRTVGDVYREIAVGIHPRIHSVYVAIAVNYLAEVLELMPAYAEASGQGKRRDPVTVYGNVGAINSEVNNSNVSVADTVNNIGTTIKVIADRGHSNVAAAIRALAEAIQHDPDLAEDLRGQLLDNVADVADAVAAPDEPRKRSRARAAVTAITNAASASSQLAQAVSNWHDVLGKLF